RAQREQRHAGLAALEPPADAERPLGEDPDHAAALEGPEGVADRTGVWACEVERDAAGPAMDQRMEPGRTIDAGHDEKGDPARERRAQDDPVEVVVVVGRHDVGAVGGQPLEARDLEIEEGLEQAARPGAERSGEEGEPLAVRRNRTLRRRQRCAELRLANELHLGRGYSTVTGR